MNWRKLDILGIGIASDLAAASGGPEAYLKGKAKVDYLNITAHATQLSRLQHYLPRIGQSPVVFHTLNFNIASSVNDSPSILSRTHEIVQFLRPRWLASDIAIWLLPSGVYQDAFMIPPILDSRSVREVSTKLKKLENYFGLPFLFENPPFATIPGEMHILEFMRDVSQQTGCGMVLDIGHLLTFEFARGRTLDASAISGFPFESVAEVHLAGIEEITTSSGRKLLDRHDFPIRDDCWNFLETHLRKMTNLKGITLEQERCERHLALEHIARLRRIVRKHKPSSWN